MKTLSFVVIVRYLCLLLSFSLEEIIFGSFTFFWLLTSKLPLFYFITLQILTCNIIYYYTLYSLSVSSLAKNLQLILEIGETYRLVTYLLADNWLIFRLCAQCMISKNICQFGSLWQRVCHYFRQNNVYKKIITGRFCFCDILNNQGPSSLSLRLRWYHFSWTWLLRISQKPHGNPVLFMVECFMRQPSIYAVSMLVFIPVPFQRQHSLCSIYQCLTSLIKTWKNIKESEQKAYYYLKLRYI